MGRGLRETVAAGVVDAELVEALRRVGRQATRSRPTPTGAPGWSAEEIDDLVFESVERVGAGQVVLAANGAGNDEEFMGWLRRVVRSTLDIRARKTPSGRVVRAIDDALRADSTYVSERGCWRLAGDDRSPEWNGEKTELVAAAWTVETATVRYSEDATRAAPIATRRDVRAVCAAVLQLSGPLRKGELGEVVAARFNVPYAARFDYLDLDDGEAVAAPDDTFAALDDDLAARWMLGQLTGEERRVLAALVSGAGVRELATILGCGHDKAALIRRRLVAKLARLAEATGGDGLEATRRLLHLVGQHDDVRRSQEQNGHHDDK